MRSQGRRFRRRPTSLFHVAWAFTPALGFALGCASPGAPHAPSLHLPQPVRDLSATRSGDTVQLRFTVPSRTTEGLPLRGGPLYGSLCRQAAKGDTCQPFATKGNHGALPSPVAGSPDTSALLMDTLPPELRSGPGHPVAYRLEVRNEGGHSAGYSDPAYVASGPAPASVKSLKAQGIRSGVLLQWTPESGAGEVLLERTQLDPPPAAKPRPTQKTSAVARGARLPGREEGEAGTVWLQAAPGNTGPQQVIDGTMAEGVRYRYMAVRRTTLQAGGRSLELRSAPSTPVEITWRDVYPPPSPAGLTVVGFEGTSSAAGDTNGYAVDLIWGPVVDPRVTGYVVSRIALSPTGEEQGTRERLTPQPVTTPAFHDTAASRTQSYRYEVTAVDGKGNVSQPATATLAASSP